MARTDNRVIGLLDEGQRLEGGGDLQGAVRAYRTALSIAPDDPRALNRLGVAAYRTGRLEQAEALIRQAIDKEPDRWEHHKDLGNVYKRQGRLEAAQASLLQAVSLAPGSAIAHYDLGIVHQLGGRLEQALSSYRSAVHYDPDHANAWNNMGLIHLQQGERDKAVECFETAIAKKPDFAGAYNNLGNLYKGENDLFRAVHCYQKSLDIDPGQAPIVSILGSIHQLMHQPDAAIACYHRSIRLQPDIADHWVNMGTAFQDLDNLQQAIECYQKALTINPRLPQAHLNLGLVYKELGRHADALSCVKLAVDMDPEYENALCHLVNHLIGQCEWESAEKYGKLLDRLTQNALEGSRKPSENPFLNLIRHAEPSLNYMVAKAWSREIERSIGSGANRFNFKDREKKKHRLHIGYLSGNVRNHPTADLTLGLFDYHCRSRFKIFCYAYGQDDGSPQRKAIRNGSDTFRDISDMDDLSAAVRIHEDGVDILVDLMGHTKGARLRICAFRPAPIQVRMLGMAGTTGASFFDYLISDRIVTPDSHRPHYRENLVRMPHCYQINNYGKLSAADDCPDRHLNAHERFVFGCFCTAYKIERDVFETWMRILKRVPDSDLWLMPESAKVKQNLCNAAHLLGIDSRRLVFLEKLEKQEHLKRLTLVDLALDTRTVNGAATTSDALWAGVPVLTFKGSHFASRMSESLLNAVGLSRMVASGIAEYEDTAVNLAQNPIALKKIKEGLWERRLLSPLFDTKGFTEWLEIAYETMWKRFVSNGPLEMIRLQQP